MRAIVKIRRVSQSLVVTLTQSLVGEVGLQEGDRVLIEAAPPRRIIISKEEKSVPNTRRVELELEVLEGRKAALEADVSFKVKQHNLSMPVQEDVVDDGDIMELTFARLNYELAKLNAEIAKKRLGLFELQGA